MRRAIRSSIKRSERGSTILEVLVALFILSALGIAAWQAGIATLRIAAHAHDSLMGGARLLQLDDHLRASARRVIPPFWAPEKLVEASDTSLSVPYLDGDAGKSLSLTYANGILNVDDGERLVRFSGFTRVSFAAAEDDQRQYGITLQAEEHGTPLIITAHFGGTAVGEAGAR
jgi:hypothetical protein